jgi:hypothetical protein
MTFILISPVKRMRFSGSRPKRSEGGWPPQAYVQCHANQSAPASVLHLRPVQ